MAEDAGKFRLFRRLKVFIYNNRNSFRSQLVFSFVFISIIPLLLVQLYSYYALTNSMRTNTSNLVSLNLQQTRKSLDLLLSGYNDLLYQIYTDDDIAANMENIGRNYETAVNISQLRRSLASYADAKPMVKCVTMIASNGTVVTYDKLSPTSLKSSWLDDYSHDHPDYYLNVAQSIATSIFDTGKPTLFGTTQNYLFHMAHKVIDYKNIYADAGIAVISLDEGLLEDIASDASGSGTHTSVISLVDKDNTLITFPDQSRIGGKYDLNDMKQFRKLIQDSSMLKGNNITLSTLRDDLTGWTIVDAVDQSALFNGMAFQLQVTLLIIVLLGVVLITVIVLLSNRLSSSIMKIVRAIRKAGEGDLTVRIESERKMPVEMKTIATHFNRMISDIKALIADVKSATIKQKEAEIHALEAQINPHFIYNTLDTINWMAIEHSQYEISNMINSLAKILRHAVENSNALVTVGDEIEWLRKYVFLQQTRLKYPFEFKIKYDEAVLGCPIHKLILQPFVENAILHGFAGQQEQCLLVIDIRPSGGFIEIRIEDNGIGLSPEMAELINRGNLPEEKKRGHIGIHNVQERLEMYYGGQASIAAESGERGTAITIRFPMMRQEAN